MGQNYLGKRDLTRALDLCNEAFELSKKIGAKGHLAYTTSLFGRIYREQNMWEESIKNFEYSIKTFIEIQNKSDLGDTYYEFGLLWKEKGDSIKAKEQFIKALDIFQQLKVDKKTEKVTEVLKSL